MSAPTTDAPAWPRHFLSVFGLGHCRPASGTWGSLPPPALVLALLALMGPHFTIDGVLICTGVLFSIVCIKFGQQAEHYWATKDPSQVVADEVAGQCVALLFLPWQPMIGTRNILFNVAVAGSAFIAFRIFDILKPPPANQAQALPAGWGILVDDLIAGLYALIVVQVGARVALTQLLGA